MLCRNVVVYILLPQHRIQRGGRVHCVIQSTKQCAVNFVMKHQGGFLHFSYFFTFYLFFFCYFLPSFPSMKFSRGVGEGGGGVSIVFSLELCHNSQVGKRGNVTLEVSQNSTGKVCQVYITKYHSIQIRC